MVKAISPSMMKFELVNGFSMAVLLLWIIFVSYASFVSVVLSYLFLTALCTGVHQRNYREIA